MKKIILFLCVVFSVFSAKSQIRLNTIQKGSASVAQILMTDTTATDVNARGYLVYRNFADEVNRVNSLNFWKLGGSTATSQQTFGTLNNQNVRFVQNNIERMRLNAIGVSVGAASSLANIFTDDVPSLSVYPSFNNSAVSELLVNSPTKSQIVLETQNTNEALKLGIMDGAPYISSNETILQTATEFNGAVYLQPSLTANRMLFVDVQKEIRNTDFSQSQVALLGGNAVASAQNIGTTTNFALPFVTNNVERMRISATGNVGIGTNSPQALLHVAGSLGVTGSGDRQISFFRSGCNNFTIEHDASRFYLYNNTTAQFPFVVSNNSNIGFGTANPTNRLHINAANPLRLEGLQAGATTDSFLTSLNGVVRRLSMTQINNNIASTTFASPNLTVTTENVVFANSTNIAGTITLPDAALNTGRRVTISRGISCTATITISAATGTNQISNLSRVLGTSTTLAAAGSYGQSLQFVSDGTAWILLN